MKTEIRSEKRNLMHLNGLHLLAVVLRQKHLSAAHENLIQSSSSSVSDMEADGKADPPVWVAGL